ncbi:MAG: Fpg/Nei family DNA glycosylase [Candidatus Bathyarchaeota archaeon]|nr:MAG: Fpg/Nei family DNA glycosylase [Candidatus Bathyarchaeota archaeon]
MELPELTILGHQMKKEIVGKRVSEIQVTNPKCLNMPLERFLKTIVGKTIKSVASKGKWLLIGLDSQTLLFNPGMGADIIHFRSDQKLPEKYQVKFSLDDGTGFTIRVWWFCYLHLMSKSKLGEHKLTAKLGMTPLDKKFTLDHFRQLLAKRRGGIKSFLLDQKNIAGIGNVYVQDILFNAKLHPKRKIPSLTEGEIINLYRSIKSVLSESVELRGLVYEKDFYGNKGGYGPKQFKIAYKPGKPCPTCKTTIEKIKTGSTSSFICPNCQPLDK